MRYEDNEELTIIAGQTWTSVTHVRDAGIHDLSVDIPPGWYYTSISDVRSLTESRYPLVHLFDTMTPARFGEPVSQLPSEISLGIDGPREVDFATYFPYDALEKVDILGLTEDELRRM
jgi:hypothetical protein